MRRGVKECSESGSPSPSAFLGPHLQESLVNVRSISETALLHYLPPDLKAVEAGCAEHLEVRGAPKSLPGCQRQ